MVRRRLRRVRGQLSVFATWEMTVAVFTTTDFRTMKLNYTTKMMVFTLLETPTALRVLIFTPAVTKRLDEAMKKSSSRLRNG